MTTSPPAAGTKSVVVVFSRLGPYHVARLRGAAAVLGREGIALHAIAIAGSDDTYAWDKVAPPTAFPARVLFQDESYEGIAAGRLARALRNALDEINPLTVALPGWAFAEARSGLGWCRARKRPAIVMSESSREDHVRLWPREVLKRTMVRRFGAAHVGGQRHREYARFLGIPRAAIFYGYDAVDNDYFRDGAAAIRRNAATERAARKLPERYLFTSSRFIEKKNIDGLLRAYALYLESTPSARDLVVCGDGDLKPSLQRLATELKIDHRVHWPGFVQYPDLPAYYALADGFILASTTEQWGLVVNEAMACGLPVLVSSRCGCAPDLVVEARNGFTFDPFHPEAIAGAMKRIPVDETERARMGNASLEIISHHGIEAFGKGLLEAARMVVARTGREDFGPPEGL